MSARPAWKGLERGPITLDVPASSANLGAGFDALALALDLADVITVERADDLPEGSAEVTVQGEGAGRLPSDGTDRFTSALRRGLAEAAGDVAASESSWRVRMVNDIPLGRGLGSSAAASVAGLVAARELTGRVDVLTDERILAVATELEDHPDNAAAALLGGSTVAALAEGVPVVVRLDPPPALLAVLFIPERELPTAAMRAALPPTVPREDAVHNLGRAALAVAAMSSGRVDLLRLAAEDRLHEPYRERVYPELAGLRSAALDAGAHGACLSGAGSTVIAFADSPALAERVLAALEAAASSLELAGRGRIVRPRAQGIVVRR